MSAVPKEAAPSKQRGAAEVKAFQEKYAEAMEEAEVSRKLTETEGWRGLYIFNKKEVEKARKELSESLTALASSIERGSMSDETGKQIGESKKEFDRICITQRAFERQTVKPVREAMYLCHSVIEEARRDARNLETSSPLIAKGVLEAVEAAIKDVPKVTFDEETGRIEISAE